MVNLEFVRADKIGTSVS